MVNGSRYYRAPKSVSIASALSSALTIYRCQIHSIPSNADSLKLEILAARKAVAGQSGQFTPGGYL